MTNIFKNKIVQATLAILGVGVALGASQTDKGGLLYDGISTSKVIEKYAGADSKIKAKYQLDGSAMKMPAPDKNSVGVVLGDKTKPDFEPKLELKRWDDLAKLSVKPQGLELIQKKDKDLIFEGENIKFETPDIDYVFYDAPTSTDEGGFEYEIVLKNKPATSTFYSEINSQGLEFYKQEALTQDEIDQGTQRPENVINSYAVYYSGTPGDYTPMGGYNFRAGKFGHIYRIKAIDADGNWIWCDQNITPLTANTSLWAKTCDFNWLDKIAKYPVRLK